MARGFIRGALWGVGLSVSAVAVVSVLDGTSGKETVRDVAEQTPAPTASPQLASPGTGPSAVGLVSEDAATPEPDTLAALVSDTFAPAAVPLVGAASDLDATGTPDSSALSGIAEPSTQAPTVGYARGGALQTPLIEQTLSISTDPSQPPAPDPVPQATAFAPSAPSDTAQPDSAVAADDMIASADAEDSLPAPDTADPDITESASIAAEPEQPQLPSTPLDTTAFAPEAAEAPSPPSEAVAAPAATVAADIAAEPETAEAENAPATAPEITDNAPEIAPAPQQPAPRPVTNEVAAISGATPEAEAPETVEIAALPVPDVVAPARQTEDSSAAQVRVETDVAAPENNAQKVPATPSVSKITAAPAAPDANPLPEIAIAESVVAPDVSVPAAQAEETPKMVAAPANRVRVNRLPTLGAEPETPETVEDAGALEPVALDVVLEEPEQSPFDRFAAPFENEDGKPLMSVVLMDQGGDLESPSMGVEALRALPYPVTLAVDALSPDAAARMTAYRDAGFEVLAMVDLPVGATATDAEINLSVALQALPEVIGVLEGVKTGVQTTPTAGRQVAQIMSQTGHGFVTQNRGLNTVQKLAAREGVPSGVIFREFDGEGQSDAVVRRFMDQAAFRATRDGGVIMLGRLKDETLAALLVWSLQDRASTVAMAPVSAVLAAQ